MERKRANFDRYAQVWATNAAHERAEKAVQLGTDIRFDSKRDERLKKHECKACFYPAKAYGRIGGAAMTSQPCACCGRPQLYGSTNTDALCMDCAKAHSLCKHCAGDIDMRTKRRKWPTRELPPTSHGEPPAVG